MALTTLPTAAFATGSVGTSQLTDGAVTTEKLVADVNFRNLIINGDMSIAQRGTSATGETTSGYAVCDRWQHNASGGTLDLTQNSFTLGQTDVPSLFKNYFTVSATTGGDNCGLWQKVEDVKSVQGTYTISWYAKGTNPNGGHLELNLRQDFGSGGSAVVDLTNYDFTLTSSWQRFSYTFTAPSLSGKTVGSSSYFRAYFRQPADDNTSNAWSMDFTGVQLEAGTTASDFEFLPYDVNFSRCERYFQFIQGFQGQMAATTNFTAVTTFRTPMRSAPSATVFGTGVLVITDNNADFSQSTPTGSILAGRVTTLGVQCSYPNFSGLTPFRPAQSNLNINDFKMGMDAEL